MSPAVLPWHRVRIGTFAYVLGLAAVVIGFYLYWVLWKARMLYFGWALALVVVGTLALWVRPLRLDSRGLFASALPIAGWFGYLALSSMWAPDPSLTRFYVGLGIPISYVVGYIWARNCSPWELSTFFVVNALVFLPIVMVSLYTTGELYPANKGSVRSMMAGQMLFAIPFLAWRARNHRSRLNWLILGAIVMLLAASGSRSGPAVGVLLLLGSVAFVQRGRTRYLRGLLQGVGVLVLLSAFALAIPRVRSGVIYATTALLQRNEYVQLDSGDQVPGDFARIMQNVVAFQSFRANPLLGGGYQSTLAITTEAGYPLAAHGVALFGETGLIGMALFAWMLGRFFCRVRNAADAAATPELRTFWQTCAIAMVGMLLYGLFHQVERTSEFFVLLAWGYAAVPQTPLNPLAD